MSRSCAMKCGAAPAEPAPSSSAAAAAEAAAKAAAAAALDARGLRAAWSMACLW
jgi:hypothetical protein